MRGVDGGQRLAVDFVVVPVLLGLGLRARSGRRIAAGLAGGPNLNQPALGLLAGGGDDLLQPLLNGEQLPQAVVERFVGRRVRHVRPPLSLSLPRV